MDLVHKAMTLPGYGHPDAERPLYRIIRDKYKVCRGTHLEKLAAGEHCICSYQSVCEGLVSPLPIPKWRHHSGQHFALPGKMQHKHESNINLINEQRCQFGLETQARF